MNITSTFCRSQVSITIALSKDAISCLYECISILLCILMTIRYSDWLRAGRTDDRGWIPGGGWEFFSSTPCPDRLWGPPGILLNVYRRLFPWGVKLATHICLSAEIKECMELYCHFPNTPSWHGAQFKKKHRDYFTFTFTFRWVWEVTAYCVRQYESTCHANIKAIKMCRWQTSLWIACWSSVFTSKHSRLPTAIV